MIKPQKPSYTGHRNRIKDKYSKSGINGWHDYEVLELALSYAIPRKDTKSIAKDLLSKFKTINGVLDADRKDLEAITSISEHTALFLKLLKDVTILYMEKGIHNRDLLSSPQIVYDYLRTALKGAVDEEFKMLFLDSSNQLITVETLKTGTVNKSAVYPRKVVERALYNHAVGVIIAHNHPSGALHPSQNDREITKAIKDALKTVEITLLDHIIIGNNDYFSFKNTNEDF
ncbi:MAG: DNA repair protein RadC [Kiritimatiellae bacterium]|nr:DNA repair protein RadC [Kiritimatiellia bacterium]